MEPKLRHTNTEKQKCRCSSRWVVATGQRPSVFFSSLGFPICFISFCFSLVASISGIFLFRCPSGAALAACASSTAVAPLQIGLAIALLGFAERDFEKKNGKSTSNSNAIFVKSNSDNANGRNSCRLARVRFCLRL